ncbi:hypothetical protein HIM_02730 [Hirsutella minnesotensis 3608]|nr:hypothetical protein HIM_02730 [Hirsutella minnesotensis 3608]
MAFQTSVLRDGQWVTQTVNFQSALRQAAAAPGPRLATEHRNGPPSCGVLSRTVLESPTVHRVLPVRLRSKTHNDIAFIGERFVQISELRRDGQVHEVAQKRDFGSRIRSAVVFGDALEHGLDDGDLEAYIKPEDIGSPRLNISGRTEGLPPQLLVLMLDSGEAMFLFLREQPNLAPEFVLQTYTLPRTIRHLGYHLVIDPSSSYMATSSPEGLLVTFELEKMSKLSAEYSSRGSFTPVRSVRLRTIQGLIHKLEFLHPRPEDDYHIILILIVIRKERSRGDPVTRMVIYEWEVGESLKDVFAREKTGNRLPQEHKMPLLLIPLRFSTAFFTVSEEYIGIVKHSLSGSPVFESLCADPPSQTKLHHGARPPLWTAWARPFRRQQYFEKTDIIYLAREDGAIIHIEIEAMDLVPSVTNVGCLDTNINTAFTTAYDIFSDILIIGGDSGSGGIWKLAPRTDLEQVSILPNWSPVVDVAMVSYGDSTGAANSHASMSHQAVNLKTMAARKPLAKPDAMFTASGRGLKGSVTQWRWGIQGRIGLDIESGEPIRYSWAFSETGPEDSSVLCALLALPHSTALLRFSEDFGQVDALTSDDTHFDLTSRTLEACRSRKGILIQVTEKAVTTAMGLRHSYTSFDRLLGVDNATAGNACCADDVIILSTHTGKHSRLHSLRVTEEGADQQTTWNVEGDVTCLALFDDDAAKFVLVGSVFKGQPWISVYSLYGELIITRAVVDQSGSESSTQNRDEETVDSFFESLTSICQVCHDAPGQVFLVAGTRCGNLLSITFAAENPVKMTWSAEQIGIAPVELFPTSEPFNGTAAALLCCDNSLIMMTNFSTEDGKFHGKHFIWLTDAKDASMPSPPVHSVCSLTHSISEYPGHMSLMAQAGSRLLLAEIWPHVGLVPRSIPVGGTPTRIIHSQTWNCLIVALLQDNRPTLAFIDIESGEAISVASDKDGTPSDFIAGLGHMDDRIYGLHEWLYVKDGKTFAFVIVTTKDGRLLIVSINQFRARVGERRARRLQYWTRYKKMLGQPIYAAVGDDQGIIYCVDRTVRWEVLDLAEKKLKLMNEYMLDSPATSLQVVREQLFALTTMHSLEVIDYKGKRGGEMALVHSDCVSRRTVHMIDVGPPAEDGNQPVTMLSDQTGGIAGVWIPWQQRGKEFEILFEGMLSTSVRRFVRARSRPPWMTDGYRPLYGVLPSGPAYGDILGVSLDGSLQQLTVIEIDLWRFLALVQSLVRRMVNTSTQTRAMASHEGETTGQGRHQGQDDYDDELAGEKPSCMEMELKLHPKNMHIDGDLLERCLKERWLERILRGEARMTLFCDYLDRLDGGCHTTRLKDARLSREEMRRQYVKLGYEVLEYLLAPVM